MGREQSETGKLSQGGFISLEPLSDTTPLTKRFLWTVGSLIGFGVLLRVIGFPLFPTGLHQDEMNAAYEAWSLAHYGVDRWGEHWPAYFKSWGSGQNILYSLILIPFMLLFGDADWVVRLPALLAGLGLIPVTFFLVKQLHSVRVAWIVATVVAVLPGLIFASRWAVEPNITPFLIGVGLLLLVKGLHSGKKRYIIPSLPVWGLVCYSYGLTLVPVGVFLIIVVIAYWRKILSKFLSWFSSGVFFLLGMVPLLLFTIKNYILKGEPFPFENSLPFSLPALESSRVEEIALNNSPLHIFGFNISNLLSGLIFDDFAHGYGPYYFPGMFLLAVIAVVGFVAKKQWNVLILWFFAALTVFPFFPLNSVRGNLLYLPVAYLTGVAVLLVLDHYKAKIVKVGATIVTLAVLLLNVWAGLFFFKPNHYYFNEGIDDAYEFVETVTDEDSLVLFDYGWKLTPYMVMWEYKITPEIIASQVDPEKQIGNFYFTKGVSLMPEGEPFVAVTEQDPRFLYQCNVPGENAELVGEFGKFCVFYVNGFKPVTN